MSANRSVNYSTIFIILLIISLVWLLVTLGWAGYTLLAVNRTKPVSNAGGNPQQQVITTALQTLDAQTVEVE